MIMQFFLTVEDLKKMMTDCAHDDHLSDGDENVQVPAKVPLRDQN